MSVCDLGHMMSMQRCKVNLSLRPDLNEDQTTSEPIHLHLHVHTSANLSVFVLVVYL